MRFHGFQGSHVWPAVAGCGGEALPLKRPLLNSSTQVKELRNSFTRYRRICGPCQIDWLLAGGWRLAGLPGPAGLPGCLAGSADFHDWACWMCWACWACWEGDGTTQSNTLDAWRDRRIIWLLIDYSLIAYFLIRPASMWWGWRQYSFPSTPLPRTSRFPVRYFPQTPSLQKLTTSNPQVL
jgi:hypothetical protein